MHIILLAKILAALEWKCFPCPTDSVVVYIRYRYPEILSEVQSEFNHLYLEL